MRPRKVSFGAFGGLLSIQIYEEGGGILFYGFFTDTKSTSFENSGPTVDILIIPTSGA